MKQILKICNVTKKASKNARGLWFLMDSYEILMTKTFYFERFGQKI